MSNMKTTLTMEDGTVIEDGSPLAVTLYYAKLREAEDALSEARMVLASVPDEVQHVWWKRHDRIAVALTRLMQPVSRFNEDFTKRGLESAVKDARWRKEI